MSGIIARELKKSNKLLSKFSDLSMDPISDWKSEMWSFTYETINDKLTPTNYEKVNTLAYRNWTSLFGKIGDSDYPIDAIKDKWKWIVKFNKLGANGEGVTYIALRDYRFPYSTGSYSILYTSHLEINSATNAIAWNTGYKARPSYSSQGTSFISGVVYLCVESPANSNTYSYSYSTNGTNFISAESISSNYGLAEGVRFAIGQTSPDVELLESKFILNDELISHHVK